MFLFEMPCFKCPSISIHPCPPEGTTPGPEIDGPEGVVQPNEALRAVPDLPVQLVAFEVPEGDW